MEICYLAKGTQVYEVHGTRQVLTGNDVYVTFPSEEHSSDGFPEDKGILYWMLVRLSDEPFLLYTPDRARPLLDALRNLPRRSFRGTKMLGDLLDDIITAYFSGPESFAELIISTKVVEFLLEVLNCAHASTDTPPPDDVKTALDYVEENLLQAVTVGELAGITGLSISRFKAKFKAVVGIPPAEYILRRKIDLAKRLLLERDRSITSIAYSLDFSSSQYFATVFKRFVNQQPSEYRSIASGEPSKQLASVPTLTKNRSPQFHAGEN
jgi:AraC-like DNA-binding protein